MSMTEFIKDYHSFVSTSKEKYYKTTLFENDALLVGTNCFEPGQEMRKHAHTEQNRFYLVLEGQARVCLDEDESDIFKDQVFFVPAGHAHWLKNTGQSQFVVLVGIAPAHAD